MGDGEQGQHWLESQRISTSPSPYRRQQATNSATAASGDESSILGSGTMERQPRSQDQSQAGETPGRRWDWTRKHTGASSRTPGTKRRRRSSSLNQGGQLQGFGGEARGRDYDPPPARRQRVVNESENDRKRHASSSLPAETRRIRRASRSLSPLGGPTRRVGEIWDYATSGQRTWSPPDPILNRNREDVLMRTACPPRLPPVDRGGSDDGHDHSPLGSHDRGASQDREGSRRHSVQAPVTGTLSNNPQNSERAHQSSPPVRSYGPTYNIASAGNVFMGINNGNAYMGSDSLQSTNEFIRSLPDILKICFQADHLYHASGDEAALRRSQCTKGTRTDIIGGVLHWATNRSSSSEIVYWLSGQAGAGKTTIAYTIACQLETLSSSKSGKAILGGSFFCSRLFPDTRSASAIIRTLVYQLALRSMAFRKALKAHGRFETVTHGPRSQLMGLLVKPWIQSRPERVKNEPCYVLPIDALDELEGAGGVEFLSTLFDIVNKHDLSGLKIFVTSRSEPALVKQIGSFTN